MTVKDYLKKNNVSQSLLARAAGIAPSILTKHLRGQPVSPVTAARLELATDGEISAMEVLYGSLLAARPVSPGTRAKHEAAGKHAPSSAVDVQDVTDGQ